MEFGVLIESDDNLVLGQFASEMVMMDGIRAVRLEEEEKGTVLLFELKEDTPASPKEMVLKVFNGARKAFDSGVHVLSKDGERLDPRCAQVRKGFMDLIT